MDSYNSIPSIKLVANFKVKIPAIPKGYHLQYITLSFPQDHRNTQQVVMGVRGAFQTERTRYWITEFPANQTKFVKGMSEHIGLDKGSIVTRRKIDGVTVNVEWDRRNSVNNYFFTANGRAYYITDQATKGLHRPNNPYINRDDKIAWKIISSLITGGKVINGGKH